MTKKPFIASVKEDLNTFLKRIACDCVRLNCI